MTMKKEQNLFDYVLFRHKNTKIIITAIIIIIQVSSLSTSIEELLLYFIIIIYQLDIVNHLPDKLINPR